jgi:hypothetical protein
MTGMIKQIITSSATEEGVEEIRKKIFRRTLPALMTAISLLFLVGRIIGKSYCCNNTNNSFLHRKLQSIPPYKVTCHFTSIIVPLLIINWGGWGIYHREGLLFVRFVTAVISGIVMNWAKTQSFFYCSNDVGGGDGGDLLSSSLWNDDEVSIEEGRPFIHSFPTTSNDNHHNHHNLAEEEREQQQWIDWHWLAGAGCSSLLGGYIFYPLNRIMVSWEPNAFVVLLTLIAIGMGIHRHLSRHLSAGSSNSIIKVDRAIASGGCSDDMGTAAGVKRSLSSSMIQRRNQQHSYREQQQQQQQHLDLYRGKSHSRQRLYSDNSTDSSDDQFFDCLDDIEIGFSDESNNNNISNSARGGGNYDRQIATYSGRKVIYSDGSNAYIPAGESISSIPPGYLSMNNNDQVKSQSKYEATQEWRRTEQIHCIHSRPHSWFTKIKAAYPHVIHGFTPDGMPVIYEAPGKMNLKQLFRNGCRVKDMVFHYCYLMEYLSNIESVLSEVNANEVNNQDWQEVLATYAHAKQMRLQNDPVNFGFVVVMDIAGATPTSLSGDVMTYLKQAGDINSLHYPGSMRRAICVQAPFWLGSMWRVIKGVLPASVTADLLSGEQTMNGGLKQYIDQDQIPVEYGGKSRFKLGEHPFEVGLRNLVERQTDDEVNSLYEAPMTMSYSKSTNNLQGDSTSRLSKRPNNRQQQDYTVVSKQIKSHTRTSSSQRSNNNTLSQGWDGLGASYILVVASLLQISSYAAIGSIELAMPLWAISPDGMGCEPRRTGMTCFGSCFIILQALKRMKHHYLSSRYVQKNPLRCVRVGVLTACLTLACINLLPLTSKPDKSLLAIVCLATLGACIYLGLVLGVMSVGHLRATAISSFNDCSDLPSGLAFMQSHKSSPVLAFLGRVVGYVCFLVIFQASSSWFLAAYCAITASILASFLL